jgi:hypothetical protein
MQSHFAQLRNEEKSGTMHRQGLAGIDGQVPGRVDIMLVDYRNPRCPPSDEQARGADCRELAGITCDSERRSRGALWR